MAILRAGPWGNLTDSFQAVPSDTTADELTLYPVNCAKTNWLSGQAWGAYYEIADGCCTPFEPTFSAVTYVSDGSVSLSGTLSRVIQENVDPCINYDWNDGTYFVDVYYVPYYYGAGWFAFVSKGSPPRTVVGNGDLTNGDPCDPVGTYNCPSGGSFSVSL